jgi:hypothetical protein
MITTGALLCLPIPLGIFYLPAPLRLLLTAEIHRENSGDVRPGEATLERTRRADPASVGDLFKAE